MQWARVKRGDNRRRQRSKCSHSPEEHARQGRGQARMVTSGVPHGPACTWNGKSLIAQFSVHPGIDTDGMERRCFRESKPLISNPPSSHP